MSFDEKIQLRFKEDRRRVHVVPYQPRICTQNEERKKYYKYLVSLLGIKSQGKYINK